ncbi:MAG: PLDc N-terminal domain-containing protein [Planctomycetaceae bacterium]|nr:PLDc N-terminal domain-containing protein [Planctomycetaceae bacterium]
MSWVFWSMLLTLAERCLAGATVVHAVLHRREVKATLGWVGLIWFTPLFGTVVYYAFGINRLERRGCRWQRKLEKVLVEVRRRIPAGPREILQSLQKQHPKFRQMDELVTRLTASPLLAGNQVESLVTGEAAFSAMLEAIEQARHTIALQSYIFDNDRAGQLFIEALERAQQRGVQIRILIDDVGSRYSRPTSVSILRSRGIPCETFLPTYNPASTLYSNLRNHRKLLIVDGEVAFTGGMNIREGLRADWKPKHPIQDLHFKFVGPVVLQLQEVFSVDWCFVTNEILTGDSWFPTPQAVGRVLCRAIPDGPDEDFEKLKLTILGALQLAERQVYIITPYFLPDEAIMAALNVAALRGVRICILIPEVNNILPVQWACQSLLPELIERGCEVFLTPAPFDHTKLFLVDGDWSLVGSTNWDPRSLRLNFELNVECYGSELNAELSEFARVKLSSATPLLLQDLQRRSFLTRLRDGVARLGSPYL